MTVDINLVVLAQQGDLDAFAELYKEIQGDMYRFALYSLGSRTDAEDAVSDTFVEAFKSIKNLKSPEAFKSWMLRILSVQCKRKIKKYIFKREYGSVSLDEISEHISDSSHTETAAERVALLQAMNKLAYSERMIVLLYAVHGYTVKEISDILNKPKGTVSSRLYRALDKLKKQLKSGEIHE